MSRVRNVQLTVTPGTGNQWNVEVSYEARFTSIELSKNIRFSERITLFGDDRVNVTTQNQTVTNVTRRVEELERFTNGVRPTGSIQQITRTFTVDADDLDEDDGSEITGTISIPGLSTFSNPADEIFAQVELTPIGVSSGQNRSPIVRENF